MYRGQIYTNFVNQNFSYFSRPKRHQIFFIYECNCLPVFLRGWIVYYNYRNKILICWILLLRFTLGGNLVEQPANEYLKVGFFMVDSMSCNLIYIHLVHIIEGGGTILVTLTVPVGNRHEGKYYF